MGHGPNIATIIEHNNKTKTHRHTTTTTTDRRGSQQHIFNKKHTQTEVQCWSSKKKIQQQQRGAALDKHTEIEQQTL